MHAQNKQKKTEKEEEEEPSEEDYEYKIADLKEIFKWEDVGNVQDLTAEEIQALKNLANKKYFPFDMGSWTVKRTALRENKWGHQGSEQDLTITIKKGRDKMKATFMKMEIIYPTI